MEAGIVMIASLTVNFGVLVAVLFSSILRRRGTKNTEGIQHRCTTATVEREPQDLELQEQRVVVTNCTSADDPSTNTYLFSSIVSSTFCFGAGLFMTTSSVIKDYPFVCSTHHDTLRPSFDIWSCASVTNAAMLSAAFGCFAFMLFHLSYASFTSQRWTLFCCARFFYLSVSVVVIGTILATGQNLVGGILVLLMEADAIVEGICQLIDGDDPVKYAAQARRALSALGCAVTVGIRVVLTWVLCVLLIQKHDPMEMEVASLGISSFAFIFYQVYALLVWRQHAERMRTIAQLDLVVMTPASDAVQPFWDGLRGSKAGRSKDVTLRLITEGLIEISSYAKTVAGAITCKKLVPIKQMLCEDRTTLVGPEGKKFKLIA